MLFLPGRLVLGECVRARRDGADRTAGTDAAARRAFCWRHVRFCRSSPAPPGGRPTEDPCRGSSSCSRLRSGFPFSCCRPPGRCCRNGIAAHFTAVRLTGCTPSRTGLALGAGYVSGGLRTGLLHQRLDVRLVVELRPLRPALCDLHSAGNASSWRHRSRPRRRKRRGENEPTTCAGRHESLVVPLGDGPFGAALGDDEPGLPGRRQRPLPLDRPADALPLDVHHLLRERPLVPSAMGDAARDPGAGGCLPRHHRRREQFARGAGGRLLCDVFRVCACLSRASCGPEAPGPRNHTVLLADCRGARPAGFFCRVDCSPPAFCRLPGAAPGSSRVRSPDACRALRGPGELLLPRLAAPRRPHAAHGRLGCPGGRPGSTGGRTTHARDCDGPQFLRRALASPRPIRYTTGRFSRFSPCGAVHCARLSVPGPRSGANADRVLQPRVGRRPHFKPAV